MSVLVSSVLLSSVLALCVSALTVYGMHRAFLVFASRRGSWPAVGGPQTFAITVQLPIYNEPHVARRVIEAACALRWPRALLEVQVLDDSTDDTRTIVDAVVARCRASGIDVKTLRRASREGYKAGALALGTAHARGELIAVFDADFVPAPDFLERVTAPFAQPEVGMVQARWSHLNESASLLTRAQAAFLDAHFVVEQKGRAASGRWFNFNGTAGIWRRACIEDAGGWQGDTLSEDVDLSYRAQLRGWRFVYLDNVTVAAELPDGIIAFKAQQRRWMTGLAQAARKLLADVWRTRAPISRRVEATLHLASPLLSVATMLLGIALPLAALSGDVWGSAIASVLPVGAFGAAVFLVVAQRRLGHSLRRAFALLPFQLALWIGIGPSSVLGCVRSLTARAIPFERTPKTGLVSKIRRRAARGDRERSARDLFPELMVELALAAHAIIALVAVASLGAFSPGAVFIALFAAGYTWVGVATLLESIAAYSDAARRRLMVHRSKMGSGPVSSRSSSLKSVGTNRSGAKLT